MKKLVKSSPPFRDPKESIKNIPPEIDEYVEKFMAVSSYINSAIKENEFTQKDVADKLGKKPPEISKWLSGEHNLTLRSILRLEAVLPIQILNPAIFSPIEVSSPIEKTIESAQHVTVNIFVKATDITPFGNKEAVVEYVQVISSPHKSEDCN